MDYEISHIVLFLNNNFLQAKTLIISTVIILALLISATIIITLLISVLFISTLLISAALNLAAPLSLSRLILTHFHRPNNIL